MQQINIRPIAYREGCVICKKANAILHSLLKVIPLTTTLFASEPEVSDDDAGPAGDDSPTLSRTIRWTDGRKEILLWKLPSPGP